MKRDKEFFDKQFSDYNPVRGNAWGMNWRAYMKRKNDETFRIFFHLLRTIHEPDVVEIGCATGEFSKRIEGVLSVSNGRLDGIDISDKAVAICKDRFKDNGSYSFETGCLPEIDAKKKYDIALCMDVLTYFDVNERGEVYNNINELLKEEGFLILQMPLQSEDIDQIIRQAKERFEIRRTAFVYGKVWYRLVEVHGSMIVEKMYFNSKNSILRFFGWIFYCVMRNNALVSLFFKINKTLFPSQKSHIVLLCKAKKDIDDNV